MESSIQVSVRIRPKHPQEEFKTEIAQYDSTSLKIIESDKFFENSFNRVFGPKSTQHNIYEFVTPTLDQVERGFSSTVMAYGQSGSGKTFTMFGSDEDPGLVYRAVSHLIRNLGENFTVSFSMMQVYLEKVNDMLQEWKTDSYLSLREDPIFGVYVCGLTEYVVQSPEDVSELIRRGVYNRCVRETCLSWRSSRSHCICQVNFESKNPDSAGNITRAKLNLIDLAGSERIAKNSTGCFTSGPQLAEMIAINKSLTNLGNIIQILASKNQKHIPFRNSKLTYLIKDSLVGRSGVTFIATISPTSDTVDESINTLKFASKAREVTLNEKPMQISIADNKLVQRLQREIRYLKDIMKIPKNSDFVHTKLLSLQEENEKLKENYGGMEKILEENRIMKEKLRSMINNPEATQTDDLDAFCEKFQIFPAASTTSSSFRQTTPSSLPPLPSNPGKNDSDRMVEVRIRKNPTSVEKRTASLHKTLDQFDQDQFQDKNQAFKAKRLQTLQQIQLYRETKAKEAMENYEKTLGNQEELIKKFEGFKAQQFSEVTIKTFRDIDNAKKATAKAEAEKEKAMIDLKRVRQRQMSRSPLRNAGTQIFSRPLNDP
jgi:hypothetical protein